MLASIAHIIIADNDWFISGGTHKTALPDEGNDWLWHGVRTAASSIGTIDSMAAYKQSSIPQCSSALLPFPLQGVDH